MRRRPVQAGRPAVRPVRAGRCRWLGALTLAGAGALLAGCAPGVHTLSFPSPTSVPGAGAQATLPTLPAGLTAASEDPVTGATTTTAPAVGPGPDTLNGTVLGPAGPVGGAVVEADRLVGDSVATTRTTTATDGSWSLRNVLGGRYRVRAWKGPNLDLTSPQIVFLTAEPQSLSLQLTAYPAQVNAAVNPPDPVQGQPVSLVVQVLKPAVGANGVLAYAPVAGAPVTLVDGFGWQVAGANPAPTDGRGQALFTVSCTAPGPDPLSAQVAGAAPAALQMPTCNAPPAPTTTAPAGGPGGPGGGSPPTSICPGGPSSTTGDPNSTTTLVFGNC